MKNNLKPITTLTVLLTVLFAPTLWADKARTTRAIANDLATGPAFNTPFETYRFVPSVRAIPKREAAGRSDVIAEKGSVALVQEAAPPAANTQQAPQNAQGAQSESTSAVDNALKHCGHCEVLWNARTQNYAVLYPTFIMGLKADGDRAALQQALDVIPGIRYEILSQFANVTVTDMANWLAIKTELDALAPMVRFVQPEIREQFHVPQ